jgi:O-antigen/teichoic acid export membrane protein
MLLKNIFGSWLGLGASMAVGFFLTPFILHHLGNVGYGLWVLTTTVTGYYGMLDFGLRSAIIRFVSRDAANQKWEAVSETTSTIFASYSLVGLAITLITLILAWKFDACFHVAPEWSIPGKILLIVMGCGTGLTMPWTVFGGILEGVQRFYLVGLIQAIAVLIRASLTIAALRSGYGLVALGAISIAATFACNLIYSVAVSRICPELRVRWSKIRISQWRVLFQFGVITFVISIAQQLRFQADSVVIGAFLSVQLITLFALGAKLVSYSTDAVQFMAQVFTPMSSHFEAKGEFLQLHRVFVIGNRYASLVILPLSVTLLLAGRSLIRVWVGPAYLSSYTVLLILLGPATLYLAQAASTKILFGMSKHGALAIVLMAEGAANLILSILLLRWYGIYGVAWGTAIPMACTSIFFLPGYLCKLLRIRIWSFLKQAYTYPLLLCLPLAPALWLAERWIRPHNYPGLALELFCGAAVYGASLLAYMRQRGRLESISNISPLSGSPADDAPAFSPVPKE